MAWSSTATLEFERIKGTVTLFRRLSSAEQSSAKFGDLWSSRANHLGDQQAFGGYPYGGDARATSSGWAVYLLSLLRDPNFTVALSPDVKVIETRWAGGPGTTAARAQHLFDAMIAYPESFGPQSPELDIWSARLAHLPTSGAM